MSLTSEWIRFGNSGEHLGYLAKMDGGQSRPGLVLIQEAWGVDEHIMDVARRFARAGYAVLAPDLFARDGQRPEALKAGRMEELKAFVDGLPPGAWGNPAEREAALAGLPQDQGRRVGESYNLLFGGLLGNPGQFLPPLLAAAAHLRGQVPSSRGRRVGSLGFCMGGGLSGLLASQDGELAAAVIFYGQGLPKDKIPGLACPLLAFHGQTDRRLVDALPQFEADMKQAGKALEVRVYPGAGHAFFNDTRPSYQAEAARDAFARALAFLNGSLS